MWPGKGLRLTLLLGLGLVLLGGCRQKMADQPSFDPYDSTTFFADHMSSRQPVQGTVARGQLRQNPHLYQGQVDGKPATTFPFEVTMETLERGHQRFDIYCSPCHGKTGDGNGMIVQRGYRRPPSYTDPKLLEAPPGHFFDVMTNGFGVMPSYALQVSPEDRWAIIAYIRALQLSQNATLADVPVDQRTTLQGETR